MQQNDNTRLINCVVADDEPLAARLIVSYVERTPGLKLKGMYTGADEALASLEEGDVDLAFLDIQMPRMSGMELAAKVGPATKVIFTTAYSDYAVEGFKLNALHYLLKPVSYEEFLEAVGRAAYTDVPGPEYITVKSGYRLVRVPLAEIEYVESFKDYVKIFLVGRRQPLMSLMSLKAIEKELPAGRFERVHRSYIVNMDHVRVFEHNSITYERGTVPVSDSYRASFIKALNSQHKPIKNNKI